MKKILIHSTMSVLAATMITGCLGNTNHSSDDTADSPVTKIFKDTIVENLGYSCAGGATQFTNAAGEFTCNVGDVVTFSIGDVVLGTITASSSQGEVISPYTLQTNNETAVNIAQLIQSCDDDGVLTPTIVIDINTSAAFDDSNITIDSPFDAAASAILVAVGGTLVSNAAAEAHLAANAPDITAPTVSLIGDANVSVREGSTYTDTGVTVSDRGDDLNGFTTTLVTTGLPINTAIVDVYTILYAATDHAENTTEIERTVNVVLNAAPVITLIGEADPIRQGGVYTELGATATDDLDGDVTADINITDNIDIATPGNYTVTYAVTDSEGKTGTATRTVIVVVDNPPVVTLKGDNPVTIRDIDNSYTDEGALATDDFYVDVNDTLSLTVNNVVPDTVGTYQVTWTATDDALSGAQTGSATRTVNVIDGTPPLVALNGNAAIECNHRDTDPYVDEGATSTDNVDGSLTPQATGVEVVDLNTSGTYSVTWTATDTAGNEASAIRTVNVLTCSNVNPITGFCEDANLCQ